MPSITIGVEEMVAIARLRTVSGKQVICDWG